MLKHQVIIISMFATARCIDPRYAVNMTVYHVTSLADGIVPVNMDTSNLAGDVFFDLRSVVLPLECGTPHAWSGDCDNKEISSDDDVISKLVIEVDSRFGEYARCNVCDNGTDPFSGLACESDAYFCTCGSFKNMTECDEKAVGFLNISESFKMLTCDWKGFVASPWRCWSGNVWLKTGGGAWYSTLAQGKCPGENCTWNLVSVEKVVSKKCSDNQVFDFVEGSDSSYGCFDQCGATNGRNTSDPCWIGCFYQTVLGPKAMLPKPLPGYELEGVSTDDLIAAWSAAFDSDDSAQGGCPPHPQSQLLVDTAMQTSRR